MWLNKSLPWGEIRGKLSLTPEQAQKMLGFKMKEGAKGVVLRKVGDRILITNFFSSARRPGPSKNQKLWYKPFGILTRLAKEHLRDLIWPIWNPLITNQPYTGVHLFMSVNLKRIGREANWANMIISRGELKAPEINYGFFCSPHKVIKLKVKETDNEIGVGIFDKRTNHFYHYRAKKYSYKDGIIWVTYKGNLFSPIAYLYFKRTLVPEAHPSLVEKGSATWRGKAGDYYSCSSSIILKRCPMYSSLCNLMGGPYGKIF